MILILSGRSRLDFYHFAPPWQAGGLPASRDAFFKTLASRPCYGPALSLPSLPFPNRPRLSARALCQRSSPENRHTHAPACAKAQVFRNYYFPTYLVKYLCRKLSIFFRLSDVYTNLTIFRTFCQVEKEDFFVFFPH